MRYNHNGLILAAALLHASLCLAADAPPNVTSVVRVAATVNGVFSPRGFFNILVPLETIDGVEAVKLDLKLAKITIDFKPGTAVTQEQIRQVMVDAGYRPGAVVMESIPEAQATETGAGWMIVKHPTSKNPLIRWAQINF